MSISTNDQYIAAVKQRVGWMRNGTVRTTVGGIGFLCLNLQVNRAAVLLRVQLLERQRL